MVLDVLDRFAFVTGRTLERHARIDRHTDVDGVLRGGVGLLAGPTLVEVRRELTPKSFQRLIRSVAAVAAKLGTPSVLVVVGHNITDELRTAFVQQAAFDHPQLGVELWDLDRLMAFAAQYEAMPRVLSSAVSGASIDKIVEREIALPAGDWQQTNAQHLNKLREALRANNLVLFLGAGVSAECGAPMWSDLLHRLLIALVRRKAPHLHGEQHELVRRLKERHGSAPLQIARLVRAGLQEDFADTVALALYGSIKPHDNSALLCALADLCARQLGAPSVRAVVTYNFDDLLEEALIARDVPYRSIFREADAPLDAELPVFHVHGFLPREENRRDQMADSLLVFAEDGYHLVYNDPFSWSNIVQLSLLRERTCVLVGLSGTDPNLRRLAEQSAKRLKAARHYVFLQRDSRDDADEHDRALEGVYHGLQEESLRELGLNVIWFRDYADLPLTLQSLRA